jgi:hypothetical protein
VIVGLSLAVASISCIPGPRESGRVPSPYDLKVDTMSRGAIIYWSVNRREGQLISGYNVYLSRKPPESNYPGWHKSHAELHNSTPYPGDTDGDITRESFEITGLENGRTYFVTVRTVAPDGSESKQSNMVEFRPLARGEFIISDNHLGDNGGFSFDHEISIPARDRRCDLYLYSRDDVLGLSSPSRLGAGLRKTIFAASSDPGNADETIRIREGSKIVVNAKHGLAELTVRKIKYLESEITVVIEYIFFPPHYNPE